MKKIFKNGNWGLKLLALALAILLYHIIKNESPSVSQNHDRQFFNYR